MRFFSSNQSKNKISDDSKVIPITEENTDTDPKAPNQLSEIIRFSIIALLIVFPIRLFVAQPFIVSGASMMETFHNGEYLIVDQVSYQLHDPRRGDVVIFRYPRDPSKFFIKRIIGTPGDTVIIEGSKVTIKNTTYPEGLVLSEPYIKSMNPNNALTETLGDREYFVMGDNRDQSSDSRVWGILMEDRIVGRAFLRLFPPQVADVWPGAIEEK